jgi:hypothetical protein
MPESKAIAHIQKKHLGVCKKKAKKSLQTEAFAGIL